MNETLENMKQHINKPDVEKRNDLIKEMFKKYQDYKTLERVAKDYGYTRERVRQYFEVGNKTGVINYKPFNRENFKKLKDTLSKEKLIELFSKFGTVRQIAENEKISISHVNRLVQIYDLDISHLRKEHLKKGIIEEYKQLIEKAGNKNLSTYDLLSVKNGRNLWARIARTWGTFRIFRDENNIVLQSKPRRKKK